VDPTEIEHVMRYRKKVEKDEEYIKSIAGMIGEVEELVKQNNAVDIYEEYFAGSVADHSTEQPYAKTLTVFRDPRGILRRVRRGSLHGAAVRQDTDRLSRSVTDQASRFLHLVVPRSIRGEVRHRVQHLRVPGAARGHV